MVLALPVSQGIINRLDISLLFLDPVQSGLLLAGQAVYLLVFFLGALPIGLVFVQYSSGIGSLYCANLIGSGAGGILVILIMYCLPPQVLPALTALLPWTAAMLVAPRGRIGAYAASVLSLIVIGFVILTPLEIKPSQYKAIRRTLDLPEAKVVRSKPSPYGLVQLVTAPSLRYAPGLSLIHSQEVQPLKAAVFSNGNWFGAVWGEDASLFKTTMSDLPFAIHERDNVLVLDAGTGTDIFHALSAKAESVRAVEPHREAVQVVVEQYGSDAFYHSPKVRYEFISPRTWLATDESLYDLITLPDIGTFGGSAGLFALQEQYLLTREGIGVLWKHLGRNGVLRVSSWIDSPPRSSLRLAATILEVLEDLGVDSASHVAAIKGWDMITFIVKRSPFTDEEIDRIRAFCEELQFDPVILPGLKPEKQQQYHLSKDSHYAEYFDRLFSPGLRDELYRSYAFNITPASDNRPFFSQYLRLKNFPELIRLFGERSAPFLELGYILILISVVQMAVAAVFLIILPLFHLGNDGCKDVQYWAVPYFSGLGVGYMFFEIVMIHKLVLYLGNPVFAAAAAISCLLVFSGLGSLYSVRLAEKNSAPSVATAMIAVLLLLVLFITPPVLKASIGLNVWWKIFIFIILIAPPAYVMGMPFPLGLKRLSSLSQRQAAWAWGINGCVSVVSTGLAVIIAVELGFAAVLLLACGAYLTASVSGWKSL